MLFRSSVCKVVKGMRRVRIGAVGARPQAFNTVRYSEKILERHGISVTTMDLSEVLGRAKELKDDSKPVKESLAKLPVMEIQHQHLLKNYYNYRDSTQF